MADLEKLAVAISESLFISSQGWEDWPTYQSIEEGVRVALMQPDVIALTDGPGAPQWDAECAEFGCHDAD